jgi:hypothetical protein
MFKKFGESTKCKIEESDSCTSFINETILNEFKKTAKELKILAPSSEDFLYFSTIMMHAAESSAINDDGTPKLTKSGETVNVGWDTSEGTWKWKTNDPTIKPYKNANGDIFPEKELVTAHKLWISKPLCIDHKSSSVDHVRGYIVDTYYDRELKRVVALCALDKKNYPDLAHKVSAGITPNVSMGTGVSMAVCTEHGCHKVARVEQDFCKHMKAKSGYGEINIGLNPIELSIVVNGADQKAKIKHIIAAANALNNYVEMKENQLNKLAKENFSASLNYSNDGVEGSKSAGGSINFNTNSIEEFKAELEKALEQLESISKEEVEIEKEMSKDSGDAGNNNESDSNTDFNIAAPGQKLASKDSLELSAELEEAKKAIASLEGKLENLKNNFNQMLNRDEMSELKKNSYYQGTVEPTPGKPQYAREPENEKLREDGDRHMQVDDLGGTEGMHPGVKSVSMSELERKKLLARAESEERAMRRNAILENAKKALKTEAYYQGGGGVNEPTPGKPKYPVDKTNVDLRDDDKHMNGQKPFPDVGSVDGLHPSPSSVQQKDELKRKEMLHRAGLEGKFVKVTNANGSVNFDKTAWEIYNDGSLILKASVHELTGGRSDLFYDSIATKEFGKSLISKIKVEGSDSVARLYKSAQEMPVPPAPPAPPADGGQPPMDMPQDPNAMPATPEQDLSDPKTKALVLSEEVRDKSSDLHEAVKALAGEKDEIGAADQATKSASFTLKRLQASRKEINEELISAFKECIANLDDHSKELDMVNEICGRKIAKTVDSNFVNYMKDEFDVVFKEAKASLDNADELIGAFVRYARGTDYLVKQAQLEGSESVDALGESSGESETVESAIQSALEDVGGAEDLDMSWDASDADDKDKDDEDDCDADDKEKDDEDDCDADDNDADITATKEELAKVKANPGDKVTVKASLATREGRDALRAKLAADTLKVSPLLHDAHPKGGTVMIKDVSDNLGKVEDLEEIHDVMMDVAKAPVKVRKEAETIRALVAEGSITEEDFPSLIAEGVDKAAIEYYKKYWADSDKEGKEFAAALVSDVKKSKASDDFEAEKVKLSRAYELAYEMVSKGLCGSDRKSIGEKVAELVKVNDDGFETVKNVVASYKPVVKTAMRIPSVGHVDSLGGEKVENEDLTSQLSAALSSVSKRMF